MPLQRYEKEKMLEACLSVFAQKGYKNTSTSMLAEGAGVSKSLIFHHFKSKKKLYFSLLEHCFEKVSHALQVESVLEHEDFFEAMDLFIQRKFAYYQAHPNESKLFYEAFFSNPNELTEEIAEKFEDVLSTQNQVWGQLFEKVPLRADIDRKQAFELLVITYGHLDNQFFAKLANSEVVDTEFVHDLYRKWVSYCHMIRKGIE